MKNTEEVKKDNTDIFSELIFLRDSMKQAKAFMESKELETREIIRDCTVMSRELFLSGMAYNHNFSDFEKQTTVFLLNGQTGEKELESRFKVLQELLKVRRNILEILGDLEEENEKTGELE